MIFNDLDEASITVYNIRHGGKRMFTLIQHAHVYAPNDLGIKDVLLCNDKIIAVEDSISFSYPDMKVVDASGKYLVPGFLDQHVHIIGGGGEDGFSSLIREIQLSDCVAYGVTTVVGLLGTDSHVKSIEALVAKCKALKEQGMSAYCLTGAYALPSVNLTGSVGKDIAFVEEIIGVKVAISDHRSSAPTKQELARLASECRTAGLLSKKPGIVHMHTGKGKDGYKKILEILDETDIPITQFRPTHVGNQLPSAMEFAKRGGYIDFTADEETPAQIAKTLQTIPLKQITLSSDANGSFPIWNDDFTISGMGVGKMKMLYDTIRQLILEEHVSIEIAISIITKNVAQALMLYPKKGCIQKGSDADIVLLDENLEISDVIALGKEMVRDKKVISQNYYQYDK